MVAGTLSSKVLPSEVHCWVGMRAEGTSRIEPWLPGITKWTTTVEVDPAGMTIGAANSHVGPSALLMASGPAPVIVMEVAAAGRLVATRPL